MTVLVLVVLQILLSICRWPAKELFILIVAKRINLSCSDCTLIIRVSEHAYQHVHVV